MTDKGATVRSEVFDEAYITERLGEMAAEAGLDIDPAALEVPISDAKSLEIVARVTSVQGSKVHGLLEAPSLGGDLAEEVPDGVQIGDLVKVRTPRSLAFGMVSSLATEPGFQSSGERERHIVEIDMLGEVMSSSGDMVEGMKFQRGMSVYPSLGQGIYPATQMELAAIYAPGNASNVCIGTLHQDTSLPAYLSTDDLLGKHFAILGTTGSGKSCTTSVVLRSILDTHPNGHIVLLDPHNEYGQAFGDLAEVVNPDNLNLPFWLLNFEEMVEVLCSPDEASREAEAFILKDAIVSAKREAMNGKDGSERLTVDTPVPYPLSGLLQKIEAAMGVLEKAELNTPYLRLRSRIENLRGDRRYAFMFAGFSVKDNMADVLSYVLRIPVNDRPVTIFDLSGVPSEIVNVVVSLLCRMIFDFAVWSDREDAVPVLLVCEEAHRYIPRDEADGFGPTRLAISRIAKEGRKYGVSICLVTQRPSELSETILSQCSTLIALRMSNEKDQKFVSQALPEAAAGMLTSLPALRNQEAIVVGEGASVPMRVRFADLTDDQQPQSDTASFSTAWLVEKDNADFIQRTVDRWRKQSR